VVEVTEVLMDLQGAEATFIGRTFGADDSSPLSFTSNVDVANKRFTFTLQPGVTYLGRPITLTGVGAFNAVTGVYDLTTMGTLGSSSLDGTGTFSVTGTGGKGSDRWPPTGPHYVDYESVVDLTHAPISITEATFTIDGAPQFSIPVPDFYNPTVASWRWDLPGVTVDNHTFAVAATGFSPKDGGVGSFTTRVLSTPEPASLLPFTCGILSLAGLAWMRRRSDRSAHA
jgi:hypothetical protein